MNYLGILFRLSEASMNFQIYSSRLKQQNEKVNFHRVQSDVHYKHLRNKE